VRRNANGQLGEWVASARRRTSAAGVGTQVETVPGDPGPVLLSAARDADLLIIGTRGANDPGHWLLGSVSRTLTRDATCPIVIVPPAQRRGETER
jgi:nucleotide-binding universal stress UspA family protein